MAGICNKCGSRKTAVMESGPHKKLVCNDCLTFIKFLTKAEYRNWLALNATDDIKTVTLTSADFRRIAMAMNSAGVARSKVLAKDYEGWTNTLVDVLEELYGIETLVRKAYEKGW